MISNAQNRCSSRVTNPAKEPLGFLGWRARLLLIPVPSGRPELNEVKAFRMMTGPFLTDLDPQGAVKGSRDPLGLQTIWARLGRHVVGNLTTVSTSVRDFATLVLGYYFAERVANESTGDGDLAVFLRWEQVAAYARGGINGDWDFRGVERARKNWNTDERISLGADFACQILSNQKTYGLWGLYTVPARTSGLVEGDPTRLTAAGRDLVERAYLPIFAMEGLRNADSVVSRLAKSRSDLAVRRSDRTFLEAISRVLPRRLTSLECDVYRTHLMVGGPQDKTNGGQAVLAHAMESTFDDEAWTLSPPRVRHLAKLCRNAGGIGEVVADRLERIRTAELLLAPAAALFGLLLASDGQSIANVAHAVKRQWGSSLRTIDADETAKLEGELRDFTGEAETGQRWVNLGQALASGDFDRALRLLLEQNAFVMKERAGAAPWVDLSNGLLRVRLRDDAPGDLPGRAQLPSFWRHSYFLDSLRTITIALRA
jgi:hypothetical protein